MTEDTLKSAMKDESETAPVVNAADKPRARLGPMEVLTLPASDSEDDDEDKEDGARIDEVGVDGEPEDFLATYPADTEVSDGAIRV